LNTLQLNRDKVEKERLDQEPFFKRELTFERICLSRPMNYVVMTFKVIGTITSVQLKQALSKLTQKHFFLKTKIVLDEDGIAYLISEYTPDFQISSLEIYDESGWMKEVEKYHMSLIEVFSGPLIRFCLIYFQNITYLVINSHHSISDGISLLNLGKDILKAISNEIESSKGLIPPIIDEKFIGKKFGTPINRFLLKIINRLWKWHNPRFRLTAEKLRELHSKYWEMNSRCKFYAWDLNMSQTAEFTKRCKQEHVTVHSGLATALLLAQLKVMGDLKPYFRLFHMPINLRNKFNPPISEVLSFFALSIIISHKLSLNRSFWENARSLHALIRKHMASTKFWKLFTVNLFDPNLLDSIYFQRYGLFHDKLSKILAQKMIPDDMVASLALTNLGLVKFDSEIGHFKIDAVYGPSVYVDILEKIFSVCTINGKMCFTLTFEEKGIANDTIISIINNIMDFLTE